jgi:putative ABC transport system substrate-binding protein
MGGAAVWPVAARAQRRGSLPRIGFLGGDTQSQLATRVEAFRAGLRALGYEEGKNIVVEFRYAEGKFDRLIPVANELIELKVDLLVAHGSAAMFAVKRTTTTVPVVMTAVGDADAQGIVANLARPGGNITGISFQLPALGAKRLEMLKEAVPRIAHVAVLTNPNNPAAQPALKAMEAAAVATKVELHPVSATGPNDLAGAFSMIARRGCDALVVPDDQIMIANGKMIANLAMMHGIPSAGFKEIAAAGGLLAYGPNRLDMFRRVSYFVDKILKGAKPADLPVEQPTKFELVINLKTAQAMGLEVSPFFQQRADEVIE